MKKYIILIILIITSLTSCRKDNNINEPVTPQEQLPPATQEGKNTFGCLVNGEVWLPEVKPYQMFLHRLTSSYDIGQLHIAAVRSVENTQGVYNFFDLIVIDVTCNSTGLYYINKANNTIARYSNILNGCIYETDSIDVGTVNIIKLDTINFIISGTFEFSLNTSDCNSIVVSDGRFDIKYAN